MPTAPVSRLRNLPRIQRSSGQQKVQSSLRRYNQPRKQRSVRKYSELLCSTIHNSEAHTFALSVLELRSIGFQHQTDGDEHAAFVANSHLLQYS